MQRPNPALNKPTSGPGRAAWGDTDVLRGTAWLQRTLSVTLQTLFIGALLLTTAAARPPAPFVAEYAIYAKGFHVGTGSIALAYDQDRNYQMSATAHANGLAALLVGDSVVETAEGTFTATGPLPRRYRYIQTGGRRERDTTLLFDWRSKQVSIDQSGEAITRLPLTPRSVDALSLYAQVMWDLINSAPAAEYTIIRRGKQRRYGVTATGKETVETGVGALQTNRFRHAREASNRVTTLWLSPAHDYLPAIIVQRKNGAEQLRMIVTAIDR